MQQGILTSVDILKLDVQGYELHALKGAERALESCNGILVETSFHRNYEERALFEDVHKFLTEQRFHLFNIYGMTNNADGQLSTVRTVYLAEDAYEKEEFVTNPFKYR